jgi:hypothetical protein
MNLRSGTTTTQSTMSSGGSSSGGAIGGAIVNLPPQFVNNPYQADINPSDKVGSQLWINATKPFPDDKKITVTQPNVIQFMDQMLMDSRKFFWSPLINLVPIDATGNIKKKILQDFEDLTLDAVKKQAERTWSNPQALFDDPLPADFIISDLNNIQTDNNERKCFFRRNRAALIAERIEGIISAETHKSLMLRQSDFAWTDPHTGHASFDGPTMLKILVQMVNPTTRVGVNLHKRMIEKAKMSKFGHNLDDMLTDMQDHYKKILQQGKTHDDWNLHVYNAMLSSKNAQFNAFVQRIKDDWEAGVDRNIDEVILKAKAKYINMVSLDEWNKQDPKDVKIAALTTQLQDLKHHVLTTDSGDNKDKATGTSKKRGGQIDAWRMKKKGNHKRVDGVDYWWCPHHKWEGHFDGLYMPHKPEDHDEWKRNRDEKRAAYKKGKKSDNKENTSSSGGGGKLVLKDNMTAAMMTNFQISADQAAQIYNSALLNSGN